MRLKHEREIANLIQKAYDKQYEATYLRGAPIDQYRDWGWDRPFPLSGAYNMAVRCAYLDAMAEREKLAEKVCDDKGRRLRTGRGSFRAALEWLRVANRNRKTCS